MGLDSKYKAELVDGIKQQTSAIAVQWFIKSYCDDLIDCDQLSENSINSTLLPQVRRQLTTDGFKFLDDVKYQELRDKLDADKRKLLYKNRIRLTNNKLQGDWIQLIHKPLERILDASMKGETVFDKYKTPVTIELLACATAYSLAARLGETIDGRPETEDYMPYLYKPVGDKRVEVNHLEKQKEPTRHARDIMFSWEKTEHGLRTVREAYLPEIEFGLAQGKTLAQVYNLIGSRINRALNKQFPGVSLAWCCFFKESKKGFTAHALRSINNAVHWAQLPKDQTADRAPHTQIHLGHRFESTAVYYEKLIHEDGYELIIPEPKIDKEALHGQLDKVKISVLSADLPQSMKRKLEVFIDAEVNKLYTKKRGKRASSDDDD
jgi:hypothetical protein